MERGREGWLGEETFSTSLGGDGVTLTSLVCHINNRAFGGNASYGLRSMDKLHEG